ncbi:23S rRNA (uracil(1939)-C(5))-methyltransferase RlmD [Butyrivibrio sp. WCD3002]|uniref:23S rRNA (uracil(1939)-C(5))-methyltransferase RlmD n=1 Tax=Butyrivibrio sp. WCD3002 TaxID=1280676 RepID=UPI00041BCD28|nr:23S rRNA (uracil(1939)-C(5))-methyltransferase RlmD [Butyrivibrio sp. WCD3002]
MSKKSTAKENTPYKKGDVLTVKIEDIGNDGEGIGKVNGYTLFVKDAVIGDLVKVSIMKSKKNYAYAHLDEVIEASDCRVEPPCPVSKACGGCQIQNMAYEKQLEFKQNKVRNNIVRLGGFDGDFIDGIMKPIIGMDISHFRYRNKAQFPIGTGKDGQPIAGFYAGRTHAIIPVEDCLLGTEENKEILEIVLDHMKKYGISAYDETTGKGVMRHVLIRKGFTSGEIMVCLVVNAKDGKAGKSNASGNNSDPKTAVQFLKGQDELVSRFSKISGMKSISVNINNEKTNVILGREVHVIWGEEAISDTLCGINFRISPLSFYQVNPVQTDKLYTTAVSYAGLTGKETVWDLYCGIGTITLSMAKKAGHVYGVEVIPQAIDNARDNAKNNGITNATFYVGKAEEVLPDFYDGKLDGGKSQNGDMGASDSEDTAAGSRAKALHPDVIVVDPPRKGCDIACLETMLKMSPDRIVYVSCDSATLARDLRILVDGGYELKKVRPCDMFPNTVHVETVTLLSHQQIKKSVAIDYTPDGSYMDNINKHATYKEINEYVLEKYGFRLHSAYIAQVKREMGIEMGENYNLSKSDDYEPRQVTPEKREAIIDALKHFNMIE